jgi:hypothetical protein
LTTKLDVCEIKKNALFEYNNTTIIPLLRPSTFPSKQPARNKQTKKNCETFYAGGSHFSAFLAYFKHNVFALQISAREVRAELATCLKFNKNTSSKNDNYSIPRPGAAISNESDI